MKDPLHWAYAHRKPVVGMMILLLALVGGANAVALVAAPGPLALVNLAVIVLCIGQIGACWGWMK